VGLPSSNVAADSLATTALSRLGSPGFDFPQAFIDFVDDISANNAVYIYGGQMDPCNAFDRHWWTKFDAKIWQVKRGSNPDRRGEV